MDHLIAIALKFIGIGLVLWIVMDLILGVLTFGTAVTIAAVITLLAYIGDITIMPKTANMTACIGDAAASFLIIWAMGAWIAQQSDVLVWGAAVSAILIAVMEYPYHIYLKRNVLGNNTHRPVTNNG
ncbi:DUF2512 family protein [Bacillus daqingensis]|uniref:DUF2512 family protein n=1 Tax=Bacillus daqingensis TaxID=872396 RepID=A0ABV9NVA8_9BACI